MCSFISAFPRKQQPLPCNYIFKPCGKDLFTEWERHKSQAAGQKESYVIIRITPIQQFKDLWHLMSVFLFYRVKRVWTLKRKLAEALISRATEKKLRMTLESISICWKLTGKLLPSRLWYILNSKCRWTRMCRCQTQLFLYNLKKVGNARNPQKHKFVITAKCSTWASASPLGMVIENWFCSLNNNSCSLLKAVFWFAPSTSGQKRHKFMSFNPSLLGLNPHSSISAGALATKARSKGHQAPNSLKCTKKISAMGRVTENGKPALFRQKMICEVMVASQAVSHRSFLASAASLFFRQWRSMAGTGVDKSSVLGLVLIAQNEQKLLSHQNRQK